jgi:DNA-binding CsgD family transcriptional regulator
MLEGLFGAELGSGSDCLSASGARHATTETELRDNLGVTMRVTRSELVGRERELAVFKQALSAVAGGFQATVVIGGEAGIGKTRLIEEACTLARERGYVTAVGACMPVEGHALPHASLVGVLRDLERALADEPQAQALQPAMESMGMSSAWRTQSKADLRAHGVMSRSVYSAKAHDMAKTLTYEVICRALADISVETPVIVAFEDVHWADTFTLGLVDYLNRNLAPYPVLLIASYRADELGGDHPLRDLLAELLRIDRVLRIELAGLEGEDLDTLIAEVLGHRPTRALSDTTSERTGGNPFFVEELVAAGADEVPDNLREVIAARLRRLAEPCRRTLELAAVIGSQIGHRFLAEASDLDDADFDSAITEAMNSRAFVLNRDQTGYKFRHDLVREAVYSALLPGERARLHHRVASTIATHPDLLPNEPGWLEAELASHWWQAGVWMEALPWCMAAAGAETELFAFAQAQINVSRALSAWDRLGDDVASSVVKVDRAALLEQAADAAFFADSGQRSRQLALQAVDAMAADVDPKRKAMAYVRLARNARTDDPKASLAALDAAARLLQTDVPSFELSRILSEQTCGLIESSRFGEARVLAEREIEMCRAVGNRSGEAHGYNVLGVCLAEIGQFDEAIALVRHAVAIAEEIDDAVELHRGYINLVYVLIQAARLEEAAAITTDAVSKGEPLGGVRLQTAALNSVDALVLLGRWEEAGRLLQEIGDGREGGASAEPQLVTSQAILYLRTGRFTEATAALERLDMLTVNSDLQYRGTFHLVRAELALEEARPKQAYSDIELALAQAVGTDDQTITSEACALGIRTLADQRDEAHRLRLRFDEVKASLHAGELTQKAQVLVDSPRQSGAEPIPRVEAFASQCLAEVTRLSTSNATLWDQSAATWERLGERYNDAYCRFRQAEALLAVRSAPGRATKALRAAWQTSDEIGAKPLQARAEALAERARIRLDAETPRDRRVCQVASDLGLTAREVQVLGHLASGRTDGQIAEALFISKKTASVHVSNLLRKLDVDSRFAAAEVGREHELSA